MKVLELFGGIGACTKALERIGIEVEITDYVEIDKYAVKSFNAMHGTNFEPQDICAWDKDIEVDLIMHGSPCQDFSLAGLQAGGDEGSGTRSSLMYETLRIVNKLKPKYVIWENVKNIISKKHKHNYDNYCNKMGELGYRNYAKVLNAKDYGIPQNRERVFTISIRKDINKTFTFPKKQELKLKLKDMLEDEVEEKYYLSKNLLKYYDKKIKQGWRKELHLDKDIASTICNPARNNINDTFVSVYTPKEIQLFTEDGNIKRYIDSDIVDKFEEGQMATTTFPNGYGHGPRTHNISIALNTVDKPSIKYNKIIRKITPKECWRLMGFDDPDYEKAAQVNSNTQLYKQAGNSIVVNVLEEIFKELFKENI